MTFQTFDTKTYVRRFRAMRSTLGFNPRWSAVRDMARGSSVDWDRLAEAFRYGSLLVPDKKAEVQSREAHQKLKGAYGFLQAGYIVRDRDGKVAVFERNKRDPKHPAARPITTGHSVLLGASPTVLKQHRQAAGKLESLFRSTRHFGPDFALAGIGFDVRPVAIGLTDIVPTSKDPSPAYVWILHELTLNQKLPPVLHAALSDGQRIIGFKRLQSLRSCRIDGDPPRFERPFETAVIKFLLSDGSRKQVTPDETASVRALTLAEVRGYRRRVIRRRDERVVSSLAGMALVAGAATKGLDWLSREEVFTERVKPFLSERGEEFVLWLQDIVDLVL